MAVNVDLIRAYSDGLVAVSGFGVTNATLPTNASGALNGAFSEIGTITSDGIAEASDQETNDIFMWQGNVLARRIRGQYTKTFTFAAMETNLIVLGVHFAGSTITQTAEGLTIAEKAPVQDIRNWVLHGTDGDDRALRIVVPRGEVTGREETTWSSENPTTFAWTLSAYPDPSGNIAYRYYLDEDLATGS